MKTRCKFKCIEKKENEDSNSYQFHAVGKDGCPENESFFKWTPSGQLSIGCTNKDVSFEVGKEYYIDITPAQQ